MTPFKFSLPPKSPGVYVLKHEPTERLYVGSSSNLYARFNEWRQVIQLGGQARGAALTALMRGTVIEEWTFWVISVSETTSHARSHERSLIIEMETRSPGILLNSSGMPKAKGEAFTRGTILTLKGHEVDYDRAAEYLGCSKGTLVKRLAKYRAKGINTMTAEELLGRTGGRPRLQSATYHVT